MLHSLILIQQQTHLQVIVFLMLLVVWIQQCLITIPLANTDNGSCIPFIYGCTDATALNYDPLATQTIIVVFHLFMDVLIQLNLIIIPFS